jgi:hypothetical protein
MQCSRFAAAGCLVTLLGSGAVSAQTPAPTPPAPGASSRATGLSFKPFGRLFEQRRSDAAAPFGPMVRPTFTRPNAVRPNSSRRFICTTPVLPADAAAIDPKFELPLPDTATRFTMRIVPPICR